MNDGVYDIAVIGGGINGCGIARDAAGRGLTVFLAEAGDLARATSSASSKLIHGGLRYLEQYEFRLVREALREREVLLRSAPHLITPLRFVLPHAPGARPAWLIRAGLFLYDTLGARRRLSRSRRIDLRAHHAADALLPRFATGFEYADCWVDDARLVVTVAKDARRLGAVIATRTRCESARRVGGLWEVTVRTDDGATTLRAKALVNATGPWVGERFVVGDGGVGDAGGVGDDINPRHPRVPLSGGGGDGGDGDGGVGDGDGGDDGGVGDDGGDAGAAPAIRLVQGSHIVVRKWYAGAHAYILQNPDRRVVFVLPFLSAGADLALVGTTETDYRGDPAAARITTAEIDYLRAAVSRYFAVELAPADIVGTFSGVRPLFDDGAAAAREVTRDYRLALDDGGADGADVGGAPQLTIYGGKLTTFRKLAEAALDKLAAHFPTAGPAWTAEAFLPGARPGDGGIHHRHPRSPLSGGDGGVHGDGDGGVHGDGDGETVDDALRRACPFLPPATRTRIAAAYGWQAFDMLGNATVIDDLGAHFGHGLYAREADYLRTQEWAHTVDDILTRRSKLGLRFAAKEASELDVYLRG